MDQKISAIWKVYSQSFDPDQYEASFTIINNSGQKMTNTSWKLHYNQIVAENIETDVVRIERVTGDYFVLTPLKSFKTVHPGDTVVIKYTMPGQFKRISFKPLGLFMEFENGDIFDINEYKTQIFKKGYPGKWLKEESFVTAEKLFEAYRDSISNGFESQIVPSPFMEEYLDKEVILDTVKIGYPEVLANEANKLGSMISLVYNGPVILNPDGEGNINLIINKALNNEDYRLSSTNDKIDIEGGNPAGVFYGVQSLIQLIEIDGDKKSDKIKVPAVTIEDKPRFPYRGLMIDVARNFQSKETIMKMIDMMAYFKLNKLHFHLTNDEGWRLAIERIPELTSVGAFRGFTQDEKDNLYPAYGSGSNPHSISSYGNGFYSRNDFIDILRHAKKNHVEVIPEIVMPGHARAAIKSMEARYDKYIDEEPVEAEKYLLTDLNDSSQYRSVQYYSDNVICVCKESAYQFLETVIDEVISIYDEADAPLTLIHSGGDEVPDGVWVNSPECLELSKKEGFSNTKESYSHYFMKRLNGIISSRNLITAGWEEIALSEKRGSIKPDEEFVDNRMVPYIWHNKHAYELPNAGYKVVFSIADHVYFDLAYSNDVLEPGLSWAGFVGYKEPYMFEPFNLINEGELHKKENILGIQGQLWSETIKGREMLNYYAFPKVISLGERAWSKNKGDDFESFSENIYKKVLPKMIFLDEDINFRVPKPGIRIKGDQVEMNSAFNHITIRYTTDGSEPNINSTVYSAPIQGGNITEVKAKSYIKNRESLTSRILLKK